MKKPITLTPTESRQGKLGRPVAAILIVSLLLAAVSWLGLGIYGESADDAAKPIVPDTTQTTK